MTSFIYVFDRGGPTKLKIGALISYPITSKFHGLFLTKVISRLIGNYLTYLLSFKKAGNSTVELF